MFGHNSFDNYDLPFRSDEECNYDQSDFTDWSSCEGSSWTEYAQYRSQIFRSPTGIGPDDCYAKLEEKVKTIVTSMKDDGLDVSYYSFDKDGLKPAGFIIDEKRDCTPESVESTEEESTEEITGCMRVDAINYNPDATEDDGSCEYSTRSMFTNSSPEPAKLKTKDPVIETKSSKTPYLSIIAFLAAAGVLGNGVNHHYQITDRIKTFGTKILERVS